MIALSNSDYNLKFDPENFQKTKLYQLYHKKFSIWSNILKLHDSKFQYYMIGKSELSDNEYDAIERSVIAFTDKDFLDKWCGVGYSENTHNAVRIIFNFFDKEIKRRWIDPWNNYASEKNSFVSVDVAMKNCDKTIVIETNEEVVQSIKELKTDDNGQIIFDFF